MTEEIIHRNKSPSCIIMLPASLPLKGISRKVSTKLFPEFFVVVCKQTPNSVRGGLKDRTIRFTKWLWWRRWRQTPVSSSLLFS